MGQRSTINHNVQLFISLNQYATRAVLGFRGFRVSRFVMSCVRIE